METVRDFIFLGFKIAADGDCSHEIKRRLLFGRKAITSLDSVLKRWDITWPTKVCLVKAVCFPKWIWELEYKESWVLKDWRFWTVVLEKTLASALDCKEIKPVHSKGNQSWIFIGRTDVEAETPILWPPDAKNWLIGKDSDAGRDWGQEEKGMTEDEMAGWHHQLDAHEFKWTPGDGDGQGGLACCDSWGRGESDMTERLNWTELNYYSTLSTSVYLSKFPCFHCRGHMEQPKKREFQKYSVKYSWALLGEQLHMHTQSLSCVRLFSTPWTVVHQAPLEVHGVSRQEYWGG